MTRNPQSPSLSVPRSSSSVSTGTWEREEQEAEALFTQNVRDLCRALWPSPTSLKRSLTRYLRNLKVLRPFIHAEQALQIHRLPGGDINHITSITIPWAEKEDGNLILRVPKWNQHSLDRETAILDFVRQNSTIPVAMIHAAVFSRDNALGKPYVLQRRIPGDDVRSIWGNLNHSQRCEIARRLGHVIRDLMFLESPFTGLVEYGSASGSTDTKTVQIAPFDVGSPDEDDNEDELELETLSQLIPSRQPQTTLEAFRSQFERCGSIALVESCGITGCEVLLYDDMQKAAKQMSDLGLFDTKLNCLCHVDLHPGNIMAQTYPDGSIAITGILDWDEAIMAPKFMNCMPPAWLWDDTVFNDHRCENDGYDPWPYELDGANKIPPTLEQQELKRIFEESAGAEYVKLAYDEPYRLCRGLFRIAKEGLNGNQFWKAAERILEEWENLRLSLTNEADYLRGCCSSEINSNDDKHLIG